SRAFSRAAPPTPAAGARSTHDAGPGHGAADRSCTTRNGRTPIQDRRIRASALVIVATPLMAGRYRRRGNHPRLPRAREFDGNRPGPAHPASLRFVALILALQR